MLTVLTNIRSTKVLHHASLWWKTTFGGRQLLVEDDPCMLPSPHCGIFLEKKTMLNHDCLATRPPQKVRINLEDLIPVVTFQAVQRTI